MVSASDANRRYFHEAYRTGVHGWAAEAPCEYAVACLERLKRLVPGGRLLDLGCGEGRHALAAARMGFQVTAVDYEPLALKRARRRARQDGVTGVTFREANALALPFAASRFDAVLDYGCLHHQRKSDWKAYKANVLRVLKPGGFYIASVFSPRFRLFRPGARRWHIACGAYRRCFTRQDLAAFLGADFEVLEISEETGDDGGFWRVLAQCRPPAPLPKSPARR